MDDAISYSLGMNACRIGLRTQDNPYSKSKEFERHLSWLTGFADQARHEAEQAKAQCAVSADIQT